MKRFYFSHFGIDVPKTLKENLEDWIQKYFHFNGLKFRYNNISAYDYGENIIYLGKKDKAIHNDFRQFLYEYGCNKNLTNYYNITLTFLHELSHCLTNNTFDDIEIIVCNFQKEYVDNAFDYWYIPDEFEANMVVVNFINNNPEAIDELNNIFYGW